MSFSSRQLHSIFTLHTAFPIAVLGFVLGCIAVQFAPNLPLANLIMPYLIVAFCTMLAILFWTAQYYVYVVCDDIPENKHFKPSFFSSKSKTKVSGLFLILSNFIAGIALGLTWAAYSGAIRVADTWPAEWEGKNITATGYISTLPTLNAQTQTVWLVLEENDASPVLNGKTVGLGWHYGTFNLQPAQRYRLTFRAKQRHGGLNPSGFDYEQYLVARGIAATGYIRTTPQDMGQTVIAFLPWVERLRSYIRDRLFATAPNVEAARWAAALALGDQRSLNDADWQRYNATGTGHLLAVSGTHITLMGALLAWLAARWWSYQPHRLLRLSVHTLRLNVMLGSSTFYALIAGWALPAQRTVLMLLAAWVALRYMARPAMWHVMASAAAVALGFEPMAVVSPSFWLSYGAVAVLMAVEVQGTALINLDGSEVNTVGDLNLSDVVTMPNLNTAWQQRWQALTAVTQTQLALTLALIPITAVFFNQISLVSPFANAIAIPLMGWVSTPLALIAALFSLVWGGMAAFLMHILFNAQQGMEWVLDMLLRLPYAQVYVPSAPWWWQAFGIASAFSGAFLMARRRWLGYGGVVLYVVGAFVLANVPQSGWRVVFLDVGQGMAVVVHSQGRTLLFDTGPRYSADSDGAARVIVPYLQAAGVHGLDHVILSHADEDHTGGVRSLLARMPVGQWWYSLAPQHPLQSILPISRLPCEAGRTVAWAGLKLEWLHPPTAINHAEHKTNAVSCVVRISDGQTPEHSVLLAGDIEAPQEAALVELYGAALHSDVLLAPHHGSKTSSTESFLRMVNPKHVVMQNGYRNRYGHPHPTVSQRYSDLGLIQWRSDLDGAIILDIQTDTLHLSAWRQVAKRYWHTVLPQAATLRNTVDGVEF